MKLEIDIQLTKLKRLSFPCLIACGILLITITCVIAYTLCASRTIIREATATWLDKRGVEEQMNGILLLRILLIL